MGRTVENATRLWLGIRQTRRSTIIFLISAIALAGFGGPEVLQLTTCPDPVAGPGQVLIRVAASGVNRPTPNV